MNLKKSPWIVDAMMGVGMTLVGVLLFLVRPAFVETLDLRLYDLLSRARSLPKLSDEIAIVAVDDDSISKIGRWPWPRKLTGQLVANLAKSSAAVVGLDILFPEAEKNEGLTVMQEMRTRYVQQMLLAKKPAERILLTKVLGDLSQAEEALNNDGMLASSLEAAGRVLLPMYFTLGAPLGEETGDLPAYLSSSTLTSVQAGPDGLAPGTDARSPTFPLQDFAERAAGVGHINVQPDADGVIRREPLLIRYRGKHYPSFALQLVRHYLNVPLGEVEVTAAGAVKVGRVQVPVDQHGTMPISFYGPVGTFPYYSFYDVLNGKIPPEAFKKKIVLVGHMATGIADLNVIPLGHNYPGVEIAASAIQTILHQSFLVRPAWGRTAELAALLVVGLFGALALPRLKALLGALVSGGLLAAVLGAAGYLFLLKGLWLKMFFPAALLVLIYLVITSKRFLVTEKGKELVEADQIETNKMLGLSFQGQGMLDMAFEKFRKCPLDDAVKELLYNLALDFERKRMFNKAVAVYEHVQTGGPYKDVVDRIKMLKSAGEAMLMGTAGLKKGKDSTIMLEGAMQAPTLGRYEIIRELGRGAMGVVYLGKDPKINRQVAIKTVKFDDDVDEEQMKALKNRFFREAESAGGLNHPAIVRIFDAGEDNEICYMAMELLEGDDLKRWCAPGSLLPVREVMDIAAQVAEALEVAHAAGVVHRDIKPANIMRLKDGTLRVTDFGIARITGSSKTQTGTVLGTPSYMSPEQLSGKKVDGRSDLFSLGVTFYEMLTGEKPFEGESMATLMFKIAHESHPDPKLKKEGLPDACVQIINRALEKDPEKRYQKGGEMARDLRAALAGMPE